MADPPAAPAPAPAPAPPQQQHEEREQNILKSLKALWGKYEGDLDNIFQSLREPFPAAWRADPPRSAAAFAFRYYYAEEQKPEADEADEG